MKFAIRKLSETTLHPDYRWDSEYLCFEPLKARNINYMSIGDTLLLSKYGLSVAMNEDGDGARIYRMNEISNMMCNRNISKYAPINEDEIIEYELHDKDVLFNRTNSQTFVGRTGLFRKFSDEQLVFASYLVRIVPDPDVVTPEYLTAFLNTKYGVLDVKRRARISINQSNVNAEELKRVEMPVASRILQLRVTTVFDMAFAFIQKSELKFTEAQILLLAELGLIDRQPRHQLTFVKNYSDTQQSNRIDAEYYQPKYEEIINAMKAYKGGWDTLGNLVNVKDRNFMLNEDKKYKYIQLSNIGDNGEIVDCMTEKGQDLPSRARREVTTGDVIVSSIEGSLSSIALVEGDYNKSLCSTGFYVVDSKNLNSETLLVFLKTIAGYLQLAKGCSGTILSAINKEQFCSIILPKISDGAQTQIRQKVIESFALRKQSRHLLECAKRAVEIAIENDEKTAIKWLEVEIKEIQI